jgi:hypothetical protein
VSWSRRFEEPIELSDGRKLKTLAEAMAFLAKEISFRAKCPKVNFRDFIAARRNL